MPCCKNFSAGGDSNPPNCEGGFPRAYFMLNFEKLSVSN
jgi:hypothetical protein